MCPHCSHELKPRDLIPVVSWLWLRGKCRYCRQPVSPQYPLVELLVALLFVGSYVFWPDPFNNQGLVLLGFWLVFLVGLVALALYDLRWFLLPNKLVYPFIGLGLIQAVVLIVWPGEGVRTLLQILMSFIIGSGIFYALFQISNGKWIGGGDVKLGMLLGLTLANPNLTFLMIFLGSTLGSVVSLPLLATHKVKKDSRIPFGPFLIAGAILARLFGDALINWYKHQIGLN